jgi:predicted ferric reductase
LWQGTHAYRIEKRELCADRIWLLEIAPRWPGRVRFRAGQFAWLKLGHRWAHRDNPFSISNAPGDEGRFQFLIKEAGDTTRGLAAQAVGLNAYLDGPHGCFAIPAEAPSVVMLAGGIGVAPFVGLLADAVARQDRRPMRLIYADKNREQMVDVVALSGASQLHDFQCLPMVEQAHSDWTGLTGRLDANGLARVLEHPAVAPLRDTTYMVCGPAPMMDAVEVALVTRGVPLERVVSEHFQYKPSSQSPLARRMRHAWWALSAASLLGLVLALAWR